MAMEDYNDILQFQTIGSGGEGTVKGGTYRGQPVAIKEYENTVANNLVAKKEVSVMILAKKEFHTVGLIGYAHLTDKMCVVMDFAYNYSLSYLLSRARNYFSPQLKQRLVYDICCSLKCLHDLGISHEDLKPDNVILDFGLRAKICDFGHCKHITDSYDKLSGTKGYRSPEKVRFITSDTSAEYDRIKSDIYSVGLIIKEIYGDDTGSSCMSRDPSERPTCDDLIEMFRPPRVEYKDFKGVEKHSLSEVDNINIAYNWSCDPYDTNPLMDVCRQLFVTRQYAKSYGLLLNIDDNYVKHFFMGILLFHGMGCEKNTTESLKHLSKCRKYIEEEGMLDSQMASLVDYYISIQNPDEYEMLKALLLLSDKGNSFARVELMDLYSSTEFLLKYSVSSVVKDKFIIGASKSGHSHAQALCGIYGFSPVGGVEGRPTQESIRFLKRSVEAGSVLGQLILDVFEGKADFSAIRNPYAADFLGDMYFLAGNYDMAELWYHRSRSMYGLALVYRHRELSLALTIASWLTMDRTPLVEGYSLKLNKRLMLQAHYCLAAANVANGDFERAKSYLMNCTDESVYAMEALGVVFRIWMQLVGDYSLIEQKRSTMSGEAIYLFVRYLTERKELDEAFKWALVGADKGNDKCMGFLAFECYRSEKYDEATLWISRGVPLGNVECKLVEAFLKGKTSGDDSLAIPGLKECGNNGEAKFVLAMLDGRDCREGYLLESSSLGFEKSYLALARHYASVGSYHKTKYWYCTHFYYFVKPLEQRFSEHIPFEDVMHTIKLLSNHVDDNFPDRYLMRICVIEEKRVLKEQCEWLNADTENCSMIIKYACDKLLEENPSTFEADEPIPTIPREPRQMLSL